MMTYFKFTANILGYAQFVGLLSELLSFFIQRVLQMGENEEKALADLAGKHQADIFVRLREKTIGSLGSPSASDEIIEWLDEHLAGMTPFGAIHDPVKRDKLMVRRQALRYIQAYHGFTMSIKRSDRTCSVLPSSNECIRQVFFDFLKEVRILQAMYEDVRRKGPGINPDGYFRALGATAEQIRLNVGGLASYMANGEPTMVTVVMKGLNLSSSSSVVLVPPHGIMPTTGTTSSEGPKAEGGDTRKREGELRPERECYYCGKKGHTANVCHARKRDERNKSLQTQTNMQHQGVSQGPQVNGLTDQDIERRILNALGNLLKK